MTREQYQANGHADGTFKRSREKNRSQFRNSRISGVDPSYSFFCSGITEDIVSALTKLPEFRIVARHSTLRDRMRLRLISFLKEACASKVSGCALPHN